MNNNVHDMNLIIEKTALNSTEKILAECNINSSNFRSKDSIIELIKIKDHDLAEKLSIIYKDKEEIESYDNLKNDILIIYKMRGISRTSKINIDFKKDSKSKENKDEQLEKLKVLANKLVLLKKNSSSNIEYMTLLDELTNKIRYSLLDFIKNNSNKQYEQKIKEIIKIVK